MPYKRITIISGHYGSGKTSIAVNLACNRAKEYSNVTLADLDIVNPYFRAYDRKGELENSGVKVVATEFANTNLDLPSLPQQVYTLVDDKTYDVIIDLGGDEMGALALGLIAERIREENNYEMYLVINMFRPLTEDSNGAIEIKNEIEKVSGIKFTGIINNSNLGRETRVEDVIDSLQYADEISKITSLPIVFTSVADSVFKKCRNKIANVLELKNIFDNKFF